MTTNDKSDKYLTFKASGLSVYSFFKSEEGKVKITDGEYDETSLLSSLVKNWISYFECHKCGRYSYCKHVIKYPNGKAKEIQCGIAVECIQNLLHESWPLICNYTNDEKQIFIDGLYWFSQYVHDTEITIGWYQNSNCQDLYEHNSTRKIFSRAANARDYLDQFAYYFQQLEDFKIERYWLLVEGAAEKEFIKEMSIIDGNRIGGVDSYGGKDKIKPSRFELAIDNFKYRGFTTLIQVDEDSSAKSKCDKLIEAKCIASDCVFKFSKDFESSFPSEILGLALEQNGIDIDQTWLNEQSKKQNIKLFESIRSKYLRIPQKTKLAKTLAAIVRTHEYSIVEKYPDSEIIKWIYWLRGQVIPQHKNSYE